jgi:hypothetical protein
VLDGVYEVSDAGPTRFHPLPPPDDGEVARVVVATAQRERGSIPWYERRSAA